MTENLQHVFMCPLWLHSIYSAVVSHRDSLQSERNVSLRLCPMGSLQSGSKGLAIKFVPRLFESKPDHSGSGNLDTACDQGEVERYPLQFL